MVRTGSEGGSYAILFMPFMSLYYGFQAIFPCLNVESEKVVPAESGEAIAKTLRHTPLRLSAFLILRIKEECLYNYLITCIILSN